MISRILKIASFSFLILMAISCQKEDHVEPLDYSVQVIPDIANIFKDHYDLITAMNDFDQLHFGDNPPKLYTIDTTDGRKDTLGFCSSHLELKKYIKSDPTTAFPAPTIIFYTYQFLIKEQHKGISSMHFRSPKLDEGPENHFIETATCHDSVFIMGEKPYFTAYYFQDIQTDKVIYGNVFPDPKPKQAVILSGKVTEEGIEDFYIGIKISGYANLAAGGFTPGFSGLNIGDIEVYYKDFMPFTYWTPDQTNND